MGRRGNTDDHLNRTESFLLVQFSAPPSPPGATPATPSATSSSSLWIRSKSGGGWFGMG